MTIPTDNSRQCAVLVREFYESFNAGDLDASWQRYIAPNLVNHAMGGGYDGNAWLQMDKGWFPAFENFSMQVLDQITEGDKVVTRYSMGGTHTGEFLGLPASGVDAQLTGIAVDRVENDMIVEHWVELDLNGFIQKLSTPTES
jgi:predicted ester cyclase